MAHLIQPMRRQLLRLAGALLCSPVLARAADGALPDAVHKRILATLDAPLPKVLNVHHLALIRRFNIGWSPVESGAPMLNPAYPLGKGDTLALAMQAIASKDAALAAQRLMEASLLLPHYVQMADLKPGSYANGKAPFTLTSRHLALLRQQSWMTLEMLGMGAEDYLAEGSAHPVRRRQAPVWRLHKLPSGNGTGAGLARAPASGRQPVHHARAENGTESAAPADHASAASVRAGSGVEAQYGLKRSRLPVEYVRHSPTKYYSNG